MSSQFNVLLIYPPISINERYSSSIGHSGGYQIPLGIFYLASALRAEGHVVDAIDAEALNLSTDDILQSIESFQPDLVGISSTTVAFHRAAELALAIKQSYDELPIVLGGPHVTAIEEHAMSFDCFDYGVVGEGERTLVELVEHYTKDRDLASVDGLIFHQEEKLVRNPPRAFIEDLDILAFPALDLIPDISVYNPPPTNYKHLPIINVITSRGCPSQCTFCDTTIFGTRFRKRSAANVVEELILLRERYGVKEIAFVDDTFTVNKDRVYEIFNLLKERKVYFDWTCMSRINTVDYDFLKFMRDNGCWHISFGIESGNEKILKTIRKNIQPAKVREVIGLCHDLKLKTKGFFMVGHPGETQETIDETIDFALSLAIDDLVVTINTPIPGSAQYKDVDKYGTLVETDWAQYNLWRPVFVPFGLDEDTLQKKHREFYRRFYLRHHVVWRYLLSFFASGGGRRLLSIVRSLPFLFFPSKSQSK
jgi:anaerobic magnesium-protoporphyrin IX monomethyl ester cyclase